MSFVDIEFAFFLPLLFLGYWLLPRQRVAQNLLLLLASWVFYASWNWRLLPLLVGGGLLDYFIGRHLDVPAQAPATNLKGRAGALALSLSWNLGALAYFKYVGFFADSFNQLMSA